MTPIPLTAINSARQLADFIDKRGVIVSRAIALDVVRELRSQADEIDDLRAKLALAYERVAMQSELLSRQAERQDVGSPPADDSDEDDTGLWTETGGEG